MFLYFNSSHDNGATINLLLTTFSIVLSGQALNQSINQSIIQSIDRKTNDFTVQPSANLQTAAAVDTSPLSESAHTGFDPLYPPKTEEGVDPLESLSRVSIPHRCHNQWPMDTLPFHVTPCLHTSLHHMYAHAPSSHVTCVILVMFLSCS